MHSKILKLGTRKSLLAIAQSSWVAREIERLNPGIKVELQGIETKGDVILDKPLSQIEGKEFFTAELDLALLQGSVDLTVHSMKDLSLDRPSVFTLAAVPKRELSQDVILFHESVIDRLKEGKPIRIGTSSPRRLTLIPGFLKKGLPRFKSDLEPTLQFVEIRGNVNTRLSCIHEEANHDRKLDGVVLAFAGLERLAIDAHASIELKHLLENTKIMVLPLKLCPAAPAQGALAIEARTDAPEIRALIRKLHDEPTLQAVNAERAILSEWGGGCHQKLGASFLPSGVLYIQGQKPNGEWVQETRGQKKSDLSPFIKIEASDVFDFKSDPLSESDRKLLNDSNLIFIAHTRAADHLDDLKSLRADTPKRVWVSGSQSWFKLAERGIWIEGSLESQGLSTLSSFQSKKLLRFDSQEFLVLTHAESAPHPGPRTISTYSHQFREIPQKFTQNKAIYWTSGLPFQELWNKLGPKALTEKQHACGTGKTATLLEEALKPYAQKPVLFSME